LRAPAIELPGALLIFLPPTSATKIPVPRTLTPSRVILLAPDGKLRQVTSFYRLATADEKGHYEIRNAAPGKYRLYAFEEFDHRSIQDPDFLKPFERSSVTVTLREGPNTSQELSVIPTAIRVPTLRFFHTRMAAVRAFVFFHSNSSVLT
jgi:hypothetical protein